RSVSFAFQNRPPPCSTLFPYTTLFRSVVGLEDACHGCAPGSWWGSLVGFARSRGRPMRRPPRTGNGIREAAGSGRKPAPPQRLRDRKSTRLNSSHVKISYAVFCLKKKK